MKWLRKITDEYRSEFAADDTNRYEVRCMKGSKKYRVFINDVSDGKLYLKDTAKSRVDSSIEPKEDLRHNNKGRQSFSDSGLTAKPRRSSTLVKLGKSATCDRCGQSDSKTGALFDCKTAGMPDYPDRLLSVCGDCFLSFVSWLLRK